MKALSYESKIKCLTIQYLWVTCIPNLLYHLDCIEGENIGFLLFRGAQTNTFEKQMKAMHSLKIICNNHINKVLHIA